MDEDPDYDYEMDPQATYSELQSSTEEATMDDIGSEGMAMSDAGMHTELIDKAAIDVDFQDSSNPLNESAVHPATIEASTSATSSYKENQDVALTARVPSEDHIYEIEAVQELGGEVKSSHEALPHVEAHAQQECGQVDGEAARGEGGHNGHVQQARIHTEQHYGTHAEEEEDELHQDAEHSAEQNGVQLAGILEERDQLEGDSEGNGEAENHGRDEGIDAPETFENGMDGYYPSEEQEVATVRVTFNGQDFVMWSATDISAYMSHADKAQGAYQSHESDDLLPVEAPALEVQQDVLWQPLDSLFASLREKNALGDFLEETQELHLAFPDLDLAVAEDNLYCREITLDDLLQLHHGLGLTTSLHIQVSERPRFITKYNELAQHVAGILGNQLQRSSDDSEQEDSATLVQQSDPLLKNVEDTIAEASAREPEVGQTVDDQGTKVENSDGCIGSADAASQGSAPESTSAPVSQSASRNIRQLPSGVQPQDATEDPSSHFLAPDGPSMEAANQQNGDVGGGYESSIQQGSLLQNVSDHDGEVETQAFVGRAREDEHVDQLGQYDDEAEEEEAEEVGEEHAEGWQEGDAEEAADVEEGEPEEGGQEGGDEVGDDVEWDGQEEGDEDQEYADENEDQVYADEAEDHGEEAEQTFYTSINEGSEAEEDELEEPDQQDEPSHQAEGASRGETLEELDPNHAYQAAGDEQDWQGKCDSWKTTSCAKLSADQPTSTTFSDFAASTIEETEEQIVEYTEEQGEGVVNAASLSSPASTSYQTTAQRKRGLADEDDDNAQYEQGDYEAESKRVKVD
ncbi:uncharacterized protein UTRI_03043_B [Ustilago trichophora]|uniref:Uncharacterized protein n=1 Tax=Ustilago trichophora TaxID=86804 RepID=A0A5C3E7I5_9BASI|nr:uncharacterized protein UTRI_03043_B [Ustilago trichophora]